MTRKKQSASTIKKWWLVTAAVFVVAMLVLVVIQLVKETDTAKPATAVSQFLSTTPSGNFSSVAPGRSFSFPDDHGAHPSYRQEWWYFTGNLVADSGAQFGYQLTFFRFSLEERDRPDVSDWQADNTWMAHFALSDIEGSRFFFADDFARGTLGLAGGEAEPFAAWVNGWSARQSKVGCDDCFSARLRASQPEFAIDLNVMSLLQPVLQGDAGYSSKNVDSSVASYYYSYPSMSASGTVRLLDQIYHVTGKSWMDREWSSAILAKGQSGWDWFALHLNDETQLMVFQVRDTDAGGYRTAHLMRDNANNVLIDSSFLTMTPKENWKSKETGSVYPVSWRLQSTQADAEFDVVVHPLIQNQELNLAFRYYEGAVSVAGKLSGKPVSGNGYMELTGYE